MKGRLISSSAMDLIEFIDSCVYLHLMGWQRSLLGPCSCLCRVLQMCFISWEEWRHVNYDCPGSQCGYIVWILTDGDFDSTKHLNE